MSKFNYRALSPKERKESLRELAEILATAKSKDKIEYLLERLLTPSEVIMIMRRFHIAQLLVQGLTYEQIQRKLKVGKSTLREVDGWLTDAAYEYHLIRDHNKTRLREKETMKRHAEKIKKRRESTIPGSLQDLIRRDSRLILFRLLLGDF